MKKTAINDSVIDWLILYDECVITINKLRSINDSEYK